HVRDGFGLVAGNVDADFLQSLNDDGIEPASFKPGALRLELMTADLIQESLGHLAASAVLGADKQDVLFHADVSDWAMAPLPAKTGANVPSASATYFFMADQYHGARRKAKANELGCSV